MSTEKSGLGRWMLPLAALTMAAGLLAGRASAAWGWAAGGAVLALAAVILGREDRRRLGLLALVLCLAVVYGWFTWHPALPESRVWHVRGVVSEEIRTEANGQHKTVLQEVTLDGEPWPGGAYWSFYATETPAALAPGALVEGDFSLYHPGTAENPGGFDFREYLLQRGIGIGLYGSTNLTVTPDAPSFPGKLAALRHRLIRGLCDAMGEEAGGYAATMLLGARSLVPTEDRDAFSRLGIGHILSVSGFHVGVLYGLLALLLGLLRVPRRARFPLQGLLLGTYCLLAGGGAPVIRASVILLLREWGYLRGRQTEPLHLLSGAAIFTLLIRPAQVTAAGFHLTYGALLGLILVTPTLMHLRLPGAPLQPTGIRRALRGTLAATIGVQAGILLPMLYWYQELPLLSLLLNGLVLAGASLLLSLYWLVFALMAVPGVGAWLGRLAGAATVGLTGAVRALGSLEGIVLWTRQANLLTAVGCLLVLGGLAWLWRMKGKRRLVLLGCGLLVLVLSVIPWPHRGTEWIQFSVGNADAAVLMDEETVWVVDAGEDSTVSTYLHQRRMGVDTLVLTHLHRDHVAGAAALLDDRIPIRRVVLADGAENAAVDVEVMPLVERLLASGAQVERVGRGSELPLPSGRATVLWPEAGGIRSGADANDFSLALLFELHGTRLYTTGDLTSRYAHYSAVPAEICKLAHHGAQNANAPEDLAAVNPQVLLLSGGDEKRLELSREKAGKTPLWATQEQGALLLRFEDGGYTIQGFCGGRLSR
ncbi:MAG: ComEC/Rec2 family competence protein [Clostridia bacterium]|nr:ComEC/Rec2 family competence protein [Clostridia bacterium]